MRANEKTQNADGRKPSRAPARPPSPGSSVPAGPLALQSTAGNAAVVQMLRQSGHAWAQQEQHQHGAGCGHQSTEQPAVQRSAVHDVLRTGGKPLDNATRSDMESRLGADFSDVRIHNDSAAKASAAEVGAHAYTSGNHVVIGNGGADKHTLAHELTHVIQQRQGPVAGTDNGAGLKVSDPSDRFEREAEANATRAMSSATPSQHTSSPRQASGETSVQRMPPKKGGGGKAGGKPGAGGGSSETGPIVLAGAGSGGSDLPLTYFKKSREAKGLYKNGNEVYKVFGRRIDKESSNYNTVVRALAAAEGLPMAGARSLGKLFKQKGTVRDYASVIVSSEVVGGKFFQLAKQGLGLDVALEEKNINDVGKLQEIIVHLRKAAELGVSDPQGFVTTDGKIEFIDVHLGGTGGDVNAAIAHVQARIDGVTQTA